MSFFPACSSPKARTRSPLPASAGHSAAEDTDLALDYIRFAPTDDDTFESENMTVTGAVRVQDGTASGGYYYRTEGAAAGSTVTLVTDNSYGPPNALCA